MKNNLTQLETLLDYNFKNKELLIQALTHSSASADNYEKLEFLGDSLLSSYVTKHIFNYTNLKVGEMSTLRSNLVSTTSLSNIILEYGINKFVEIANAGNTRQESILNGLEVCAKYSVESSDNVIIHDAVRPLLSDLLISKCLSALKNSEGCMPVLPINDTVYQSLNGNEITNLLDRKTLFAGQAPEAFHLHRYLEINRFATKTELANIRGSSEIAYKNGLDVTLIAGEEMNFKLTTPVDLERFKAILRGE